MSIKEIIRKYNFRFNEFEPYVPLSIDKIKKKKKFQFII